MTDDGLLRELSDDDRQWLLDHGWNESAPSGRVLRRGRQTDHYCQKPDLSVGHGAVWRCDGCGKRWRLRLTLDLPGSKAGQWSRWHWPWPR